MSKEITFADVSIKPQLSDVPSRNLSIASDMGEFTLDLPVISANMRDITGVSMAVEMYKQGALGILHRFNTIDHSINDFKEVIDGIGSTSLQTSYPVGVSIGVKNEDKKRFEMLYKHGASLFCIDVAHGHHVFVNNMIKWIRKYISHFNHTRKVIIIAGNIATPEGAQYLINAGADIIKVGIGPGAGCQTRTKAGVGVPQLSALMNIRNACPNAKLIADGGIKYPGDVAKALKYANAVMIGNFIAGSTETPGRVYQKANGEYYKTYGGSASGENKVASGEKPRFVEGTLKEVPFRGHVKYMLRTIREGVQMACSYSGAHNLKEFQEKCEFVEISSASQRESKYE